jgi:hypothetical protein
VEEADSKLRRWKRLLGYVQLHSTRTDEKIRSKELDDCLYVGEDLGCSGPQELALRVLPCLILRFGAPQVLPFNIAFQNIKHL